MREGGGMFRSTDNGDSWTEQNRITVFTAFDANAVTFNSIREVFAAAASGVFQSTNDDASRTEISSGLIPVGGSIWARANDSGNYAFCRNGWWRRISQRPIPLSRCESFRAEAPRNASAATPNTRPRVGW